MVPDHGHALGSLRLEVEPRRPRASRDGHCAVTPAEMEMDDEPELIEAPVADRRSSVDPAVLLPVSLAVVGAASDALGTAVALKEQVSEAVVTASAAATETYSKVAVAAGAAVGHAVQLKEAAGKTVESACAVATEASRAAESAYGAAGQFKTQLTGAAGTAGAALVQTSSQLKTHVGQTAVPESLVKAHFLHGLLLPAPQWPPEPLTLANFLTRAKPVLAAVSIAAVAFAGVASLLLLVLPLLLSTAIVLALPLAPALYVVHGATKQQRERRRLEAERYEASARDVADWRGQHASYWSTSSVAGRERRAAEADAILRAVRPREAPAFNAHVEGATGLAIYGCGVLATAHIGALRALERHGLCYDRLQTLAGVSCGSVVVAMSAPPAASSCPATHAPRCAHRTHPASS